MWLVVVHTAFTNAVCLIFYHNMRQARCQDGGEEGYGYVLALFFGG